MADREGSPGLLQRLRPRGGAAAAPAGEIGAPVDQGVPDEEKKDEVLANLEPTNEAGGENPAVLPPPAADAAQTDAEGHGAPPPGPGGDQRAPLATPANEQEGLGAPMRAPAPEGQLAHVQAAIAEIQRKEEAKKQEELRKLEEERREAQRDKHANLMRIFENQGYWESIVEDAIEKGKRMTPLEFGFAFNQWYKNIPNMQGLPMRPVNQGSNVDGEFSSVAEFIYNESVSQHTRQRQQFSLLQRQELPQLPVGGHLEVLLLVHQVFDELLRQEVV